MCKFGTMASHIKLIRNIIVAFKGNMSSSWLFARGNLPFNYLGVHLNVLICLFKHIVILYLILQPKDRTKFLFDFPTRCYALEGILELANDIHHFIINVDYYLFNDDRCFLGLSMCSMLWQLVRQGEPIKTIHI